MQARWVPPSGFICVHRWLFNRMVPAEATPGGAESDHSSHHEQSRLGRIIQVGHAAFQRSQRQPVPPGEMKKISVRPLPVALHRAQADFGELDVIRQEDVAARRSELSQLRPGLGHREPRRLLLSMLVPPRTRGESKKPALRHGSRVEMNEPFDEAPRTDMLHVILKRDRRLRQDPEQAATARGSASPPRPDGSLAAKEGRRPSKRIAPGPNPEDDGPTRREPRQGLNSLAPDPKHTVPAEVVRPHPASSHGRPDSGLPPGAIPIQSLRDWKRGRLMPAATFRGWPAWHLPIPRRGGGSRNRG